MRELTFYCVRCREKQTVTSFHPDRLSTNGKPVSSASCPVCGASMFKILDEEEFKKQKTEMANLASASSGEVESDAVRDWVLETDVEVGELVTTFFCVKCWAKKEVAHVYVEPVSMKTGKLGMKCNCPDCEKTIFRYIDKPSYDRLERGTVLETGVETWDEYQELDFETFHEESLEPEETGELEMYCVRCRKKHGVSAFEPFFWDGKPAVKAYCPNDGETPMFKPLTWEEYDDLGLVRWISLGSALETGKLVTLSPEARQQHLYVIGQTRTGKTTLLLNIALQDLVDMKAGLCLIDLHGDLSLDLLTRVPEEREKDVILWDATDIERPIGLNLFECEDPENIALVDRISNYFIETMMRIFPKVFENAPRMEELMFNLAIAFIHNQGNTLAETTKFLENEDYRQHFMERIANPAVRMYWESFDLKSPRLQDEISRSTLNKVGRFLSNVTIRNTVGQPVSKVDFRKVMDEGKILVLRIPKGLLGEPNAELLGLTLVQKLLEAAFARADIPKEERRRFHLIADEYQLLASTTFPTLQSEAAKFGIDTVVAHQFRDQLDVENKGSTLNVGNLVVFRISGKDASELAREFDNSPPEPLVVGERQILGLSHSPWSHLLTRSHKNPRVVELIEQLKLDFVVKDRTYKFSRIDKHGLSRNELYRIYTFPDNEALSYGIAVLDNYLAARMRGVSDSRLRRLWNQLIDEGPFGAGYRGGKIAILNPRTGNYEEREHRMIPWGRGFWGQMSKLRSLILMEDTAEIRKEVAGRKLSYTTAEIILSQIHFKKEFLDTVEELARHLEKDPVLAPTGHTEPIYESQRLYGDVEAEAANRLANLRKYRARCKLVQGEELVEHTIKTFDAAPIPDEGKARVERIKKRSRQEFGRDRKEVEGEIEERLKTKVLEEGPVY